MWPRKTRDASATIEIEIAKLRQREEELVAQLATAEQQVETAAGERREMLTTGDDFDVSSVAAANAKVAAASALVRDLQDALAMVQGRRADTERRLAEEQDKAARAEEVKRLDEAIGIATKAANDFRVAVERYVQTFVTFGADGTLAAQIASTVGPQLVEQAALAVHGAEQYREGVRSGTTVISRPAPQPTPEPVSVERQRAYLLESAKWIGSSASP